MFHRPVQADTLGMAVSEPEEALFSGLNHYPRQPFLQVLFCALHAFLLGFVLDRFMHNV
jgi:hypothetical protein